MRAASTYALVALTLGDLSCSYDAGLPQLVPERLVLDFGTVPVGSSGVRTLEMTNPGDGPVTFESVSIVDDLAGAFSFAPDPSGVEVESGASYLLEVTFTAPDIEGEATATLRVVLETTDLITGGGTSCGADEPADVALVDISLFGDTDSVADGDTDADGLTDVVEGTVGTDPLDADTDDDGLLDGDDGTNDSDGDGAIDALDPDSDDDGVLDGTESGVVDADLGPDTDVTSPAWLPDSDPTSVTDPDDPDSDDDGLSDGAEDHDADGSFEEEVGELDPEDPDTDDDELLDGPDLDGCTDPLDDDSDDDGLLDGRELLAGTDPCSFDTDGDGLSDGLESGLEEPQGNDTNPVLFVEDADPSTTTDPLSDDTDGGTVSDGDEDANGNGQVDPAGCLIRCDGASASGSALGLVFGALILRRRRP